MKQAHRRLLAGAVTLLLWGGVGLGPAVAKQLLEEDFTHRSEVSAKVPGRDDAEGYARTEREFLVERSTVDALKAAPGKAGKGAISFDLQRLPTDEVDRGTVFTLAGDARKGDGAPADEIFYLQVRWSSFTNTELPSLLFRGHIYHEYGLGLWPPEVVLDAPVAPGQWIHVDLVWDDAAGRREIYVDGRLQDTQPLFYDALTLKRQPDPRLVLNAESKRARTEPYFKSWDFGRMLALVDEVHFGGHTMRSEPGAVYTPLSNAVLDNFAFYVDEIPPTGYEPPPATTPEIATLAHDAARVAGFSGKLVTGNSLGVTLQGTPGATGSFDVAHYPDLSRRIALDWRGWGVYPEEKVFFEPGEVNLRDVEGYRVLARKELFDPLDPALEPTATLDVKEQSYLVEDLEIDTPYYVAVVALMKDGTLRPVLAPLVNRPLTETEPGVYTGALTVADRDRYPRAIVVGRLTRGTQAAVRAGDAAAAFAIDTGLTIAVATKPEVLRADEKSKADVTVTVTDANGSAVAGREIRFLLATTSQYTGVVGGGAFAEQVGGSLAAGFRGVTDLFGRVTATYVAGFAAKTAVIVARDLASNSTGAGHVQTFITATAQLELEPAEETAAMAAGYEILVTSSDAWLTADGRSQARITARVTLAGEPVEGHQVSFAIAGGSGSIRTVSGKTDRDGEARALYTAGTKIGLVLITATDTTVDITGSVQIELRSDAPAKIAITLSAEKLPADGHSRADMTVLVTDINDNPNDDVEVEYAITEGGGGLRDDRNRTDRKGESENTYTAGRSPGLVAIEVTVRSTVPTAEELLKARGLAVAVTDYRFY